MGLFSSLQTSPPTSSCASPSLSSSSASPALPQPTLSPRLPSALSKLPPSVSLKLELPGMLARTGPDLTKSSAAWKTSSEPPTAGTASVSSFPSSLSVHKKLSSLHKLIQNKREHLRPPFEPHGFSNGKV